MLTVSELPNPSFLDSKERFRLEPRKIRNPVSLASELDVLSKKRGQFFWKLDRVDKGTCDEDFVV